MIAIFISCLLFIFGLFCTIPSKKINSFLPPCLQSHTTTCNNNAKNHDVINTKNNNDPPQAAGKVDLRDVFATFDRNNDGFITRQELKESLKNMGIAAGEGDVADMVARVDANGDGLIDLDEFCHLLDDSDGDLREAFEVFDGNKDGLITVEELGLVLSSLGFSEGKKLEDCKEMIRKVDVDGDGMVNFDEFKKMMRDGILN